ncbi:FecR domain-containing protein [Pseudomonadota bacterium]
MIISRPNTMLSRHWLSFLFFMLYALLIANKAIAAEAVGSFSFIKGKVDQLSVGSEEVRLVNRGDAVYQGDTIRSKRRAMAQIKFNNGSVMTIAAQSKVEIDSIAKEASRDKSSIRAVRGLIRTLVPKGQTSSYEVITPTAVAAVRGTEWVTKVGVKVSDFFVLDGIVSAKNIDPNITTEVLIKPLHATRVSEGKPPLPPFKFNKDELAPLLKRLNPSSAVSEPDSRQTTSRTDTTSTRRSIEESTIDINQINPLDTLLPAVVRSGSFVDMLIEETTPEFHEQIQAHIQRRSLSLQKTSTRNQQLLVDEIQPHEEQTGIQVTPEITEIQPSLTGETPVEIIIQFN